MAENLIAEMRQLIEEMIVPELKSLIEATDRIQSQIVTIHERQITLLAACTTEMATCRADLRERPWL